MSINDQKGQSFAIEYVLTFFLVVAVITAMSVYARRALQGRIRDTRNYMAATVAEEYSGKILMEYEPYYLRTVSFHESDDTKTQFEYWNASMGEMLSGASFDQTTKQRETSNQLPPKDYR